MSGRGVKVSRFDLGVASCDGGVRSSATVASTGVDGGRRGNEGRDRNENVEQGRGEEHGSWLFFFFFFLCLSE